MTVLGVCDGHDSGAAVFIDGKVAAACNEERFAREKFQTGFPRNAILECLRTADIAPEDVRRAVLASQLTPSLPLRISQRTYKAQRKDLSAFGLTMDLYRNYQVLSTKLPGIRYIEGAGAAAVVRRRLAGLDIHAPLDVVDHHAAHAAAAYHTAGLDEVLVVTMDHMGDGLSASVSVGSGGHLERIHTADAGHGVGGYYSEFTELLKFRPGRHEGKVVGLAAKGNPATVLSEMREVLTYSDGQFNVINNLKRSRPDLFELFQRTDRADVAAAVQAVLEECVCAFVSDWARRRNLPHIALAGGLFANVKLNQRLHELDCVESLFIHPHMGDGGLGFGAAASFACKGTAPTTMKSAYLGPRYGEEEMEQALKEAELEYKRERDIDRMVGLLLADERVVARYTGRMEYGPRALGNRSILYSAGDISVNDWLNERLQRSEFMPFAPSTLVEEAHTCYKGMEGAKDAARFMTITFDCTERMKKTCPGVVHVDGTARPQLVHSDVSPSYHRVISTYFKATGIPTILNTSFNMHEEPIVATPEDAVRGFVRAGLDHLALGPFLARGVE